MRKISTINDFRRRSKASPSNTPKGRRGWCHESEPAEIDLLTQVCDPALDRLEAKDLCRLIIDTTRTGQCSVLTYFEPARRHNETLRRNRLLGSMRRIRGHLGDDGDHGRAA